MDKSNTNYRKLESTLDHCIGLINSGISVEECVRLYPSQKSELKELLEVAIGVKNAYADNQRANPSRLYVNTSREKFLNAARSGVPPIKEKPASENIISLPSIKLIYWRVLMASSAAAAALIIVTGGLVYASGNSAPGSPLYSVKKAVEGVKIALNINTAKKNNSASESNKRKTGGSQQTAKGSLNSDPEETSKKLALQTQGSEKDTVTANQITELGEQKDETASLSQSPQGDRSPDVLDTEESANKVAGIPGAVKSGNGAGSRDDSTSAGRDLISASPVRKRGQSAAGSGTSRKFSAAVFSVDSITLSDQYLSPNGDGVKDSVLINVSGATLDGYNVELYKGTQKVATLARQIQKDSVEFSWDGLNSQGNRVSDGEYVVKVVHSSGKIAGKTAKLVVDTVAPKVELVGPIDVEITDSSTPQLLWGTRGESEGVDEYTVYLIPGHDSKLEARYASKLPGSFYEPNKKLELGKWLWRVVAIDKAGNIGTSTYGELLIKKSDEKQKSQT